MTGAILGLLLAGGPVPLLSAVEQGDQAFASMRYSVAEASYTFALTPPVDSAVVLWRLARLFVCMADVAPEDQKLELYRQAEAAASHCIRMDSLLAEGHTWRAAALGNIAMSEGGKTKVRLCREIKAELDRSISLNPRDDVAYSILGSFYMALGDISWFERQLAAVFLGTLPGGGFEESERALRQAIAIAPGVIRHHFVLGELYVALERPLDALAEFRLVVTLPVLLASDERTRTSAAGMIRTLLQE
jgi:tetratricopeptide (TPR) repeat protein